MQDSLERGITIKASPGRMAKFQMPGYPHSFLKGNFQSNKQTRHKIGKVLR